MISLNEAMTRIAIIFSSMSVAFPKMVIDSLYEKLLSEKYWF